MSADFEVYEMVEGYRGESTDDKSLDVGEKRNLFEALTELVSVPAMFVLCDRIDWKDWNQDLERANAGSEIALEFRIGKMLGRGARKVGGL